MNCNPNLAIWKLSGLVCNYKLQVSLLTSKFDRETRILHIPKTDPKFPFFLAHGIILLLLSVEESSSHNGFGYLYDKASGRPGRSDMWGYKGGGGVVSLCAFALQRCGTIYRTHPRISFHENIGFT